MSEIYIPQKNEIMPSKRFYLMRAGFKGYDFEIDLKMRTLVNNIYLEGIELCEPVIHFYELGRKQFDKIKIPLEFGKVDSITLFTSTLGEKIDRKIEYLSNNDRILEASLLDSWASESLEALNESFDHKLRNSRNATGTLRFSPGYGELSILENVHILSLLNQNKIKANPKTGILLPRKSTVCMIGWKNQEEK